MALYPEVQTKLFNEVKDVVGRDRLPEVSDRKDLPLMNAAYA